MKYDPVSIKKKLERIRGIDPATLSTFLEQRYIELEEMADEDSEFKQILSKKLENWNEILNNVEIPLMVRGRRDNEFLYSQNLKHATNVNLILNYSKHESRSDTSLNFADVITEIWDFGFKLSSDSFPELPNLIVTPFFLEPSVSAFKEYSLFHDSSGLFHVSALNKDRSLGLYQSEDLSPDLVSKIGSYFDEVLSFCKNDSSLLYFTKHPREIYNQILKSN